MRSTLLAFAILLVAQLHASPGDDWPVYLGDKAASHYSTLAQITPDNVTRLEVAWTFNAGDARDDATQIQCNPLVIDGILYGTTPQTKLFALDAATGRELWRFLTPEPNGVNRGLATWVDELGARRILFGNGHWLHAIDAATGKLIDEFGNAGRVDLNDGFDRDVTGLAIQANTPGVVFRDLIIMGMRVGEGPAPASPGDIRAYSARTGALVWRFRTIPRPGEFGHETWPADAWQRVGGANVRAGITVDEERGLVFCPVDTRRSSFCAAASSLR
jgi:quinoprotein glucose dehydrogenase